MSSEVKSFTFLSHSLSCKCTVQVLYCVYVKPTDQMQQHEIELQFIDLLCAAQKLHLMLTKQSQLMLYLTQCKNIKTQSQRCGAFTDKYLIRQMATVWANRKWLGSCIFLHVCVSMQKVSMVLYLVIFMFSFSESSYTSSGKSLKAASSLLFN